MATMQDIADRLNVSKTTVYNVFSGRNSRVSEEVRTRILQVAKELNYQPNQLASGLATKRLNVIGLLFEHTRDWRKQIYHDMVTGVLNTCAECRYRVLLDPNLSGGEELHQRLLSRSELFDGSIIHAPVIDDARITDMVNHDIPFVLIGHSSSDCQKDILSVDVDNINIAYTITSQLIALGHRHIALLNSDANMTITFDRLKGYIHALQENGLSFNPSFVYNTDNTKVTGMSTCRELITLHPQVTAIITCSDDAAVGVYTLLADMGKSIPEDVSVISLGGIDYYDKLNPILSTVNIDYESIGEIAAKLLIDRIAGNDIPQKQYFVQAQYLAGDSCGPAPTSKKA